MCLDVEGVLGTHLAFPSYDRGLGTWSIYLERRWIGLLLSLCGQACGPSLRLITSVCLAALIYAGEVSEASNKIRQLSLICRDSSQSKRNKLEKTFIRGKDIS